MQKILFTLYGTYRLESSVKTCRPDFDCWCLIVQDLKWVPFVSLAGIHMRTVGVCISGAFQQNSIAGVVSSSFPKGSQWVAVSISNSKVNSCYVH